MEAAATGPHCGIILPDSILTMGVAGDVSGSVRLAYNYNIVGNVLGSADQSPTAYTGCSNHQSTG